jgi:aryl-alcohol dehydrogenase-like predicted oxidoreductase
MGLERLPPAERARFGLGLAAVGRPAYINLGRRADLPEDRSPEVMRGRTHELLDAAYAAGIRYADVARSYGRAEEFLADWVCTRPDAGDLVVGSKWGYTYAGAWRIDARVHEIKNHSVEAFERQLGETRAHLGDRLDLYQIHSATLDSGALATPALHRRLAELADHGVTVGLSTSGPGQSAAIRTALEITVDGVRLFGSVQATWNLLEPSAGPALAEAQDAGLVVIVKEALANGRLALGAGPVIEEISQLLGTTPDRVALAAALGQPWAGIVLSGAATVDQLASNLDARRVTLGMGDLAALDALAEPPAAYWQRRSELAWT